MTASVPSSQRQWLLVSLVFGISYCFAAAEMFPPAILIGWKGAGVGMLAVYAWAHRPMRGAIVIALVMALDALGDMVLEIAFIGGALFFLTGHLVAIIFYWRHRRAGQSPAVPGIIALTVTLVAWLLTTAPAITLYAAGLGLMAAAAWASDFPRSRAAIGALMFAASDILIFAQMGPLADSAIPNLLVWPLYYVGQFLICFGVIASLRQRCGFEVDGLANGSTTAPSAARASGP
jgi:uncharacterized membrane protein YhhN